MRFCSKKERQYIWWMPKHFRVVQAALLLSRPEHISISGTPNNDRANLIGILSAYIPYRETLYSRQTGRDRMIQEENSGLTIVHPVDRIKEVVEIEWSRIKLPAEKNSADIQSL